MSHLHTSTEPRTVSEILSSPTSEILARILLTSPFWISGTLKIFDFPSALGEAAHFGLQPVVPVAILVILVQIAGSLAVILKRMTWFGAGALGVFTVLASFVGHAFWTITDPMARFHDMNAFLANMGLIGGLVLVAVLAERERAV